MALQTFANGESGLSVRSKINANFTELYAQTGNVVFGSEFVAADNVTDDTAGIHAAIDAIEAKGGGLIIMPQGICRTTGINRTAQNGIPWLMTCFSKGSTTIRKMGSGPDPVFTLNGPGSLSGADWYGGFQGLSFDGLNASTSPAALRLHGVARAITDDLLFLNSFRGCESIGSLILAFNNCSANGNGDGYYTTNSVPLGLYSNLITWNGGESRGNAGWGFNLGGGEAYDINGVDTSGNGTDATGFTGAIYFRDSVDDESGYATAIIRNAYIEANRSRAIYVENAPGLRLAIHSSKVVGHLPVETFPPIQVGLAASFTARDSLLLVDTNIAASRSAIMETLVANLTDTSTVRYHRNLSGTGVDTRYSVASGALQVGLDAFGVLGNAPVGKQTVPATATDLATAIARVNGVVDALRTFGFVN